MERIHQKLFEIPTNNMLFLLTNRDHAKNDDKKALYELILRHCDSYSLHQRAMNALPKLSTSLGTRTTEVLEQVEVQIKYDVYINKEKELVERMSQLENLIIPDRFDYDKVHALSNEALQKFKKIKPRTLGQASRISGVNPSDVQILMVYMGR
jgi:tRNA uridine 5-carboxymethylaminomethyl modification enzyme